MPKLTHKMAARSPYKWEPITKADMDEIRRCFAAKVEELIIKVATTRNVGGGDILNLKVDLSFEIPSDTD